MKRTYTYVYKVYTDNLAYGRMYLGESDNKSDANAIGQWAGKGCYIVKKARRYND